MSTVSIQLKSLNTMSIKRKKVYYYFDRIVINTSFTPKDLKEFLNYDDLKKHCGKLWLGETTNTAKYHGYDSKIDAKDVTDDFMSVLSRYELGYCGISSIEITKDIEFKSMDEAKDYQFYLERNLCRKYGNNRFIIEGNTNDTIYIGKYPGKFSPNYLVVYPTRNSPFIKNPVLHFEFRLRNWSKIKKVLRINSIYELRKPEDIYNELEARYLDYNKEINKELLRKHLIRVGVNPGRAKRTVEGFYDNQYLYEWLEYRQSQTINKKRLQPLRRKVNGKARIMNRCDKFILDFNVRKYMIDKKA